MVSNETKIYRIAGSYYRDGMGSVTFEEWTTWANLFGYQDENWDRRMIQAVEVSELEIAYWGLRERK